MDDMDDSDEGLDEGSGPVLLDGLVDAGGAVIEGLSVRVRVGRDWE